MRDRQKADFERTSLDHLIGIGQNLDHDLGCAALFFQFQARNCGRERPGIDRRVQQAIKQTQSADMVLMGMGDKNRLDPVGALRQPAYICHDQIDAGRGVHIREGDAGIHKDEPFLVLGAVAVDIAVHPDFASPAKG